MVSIPRRGDVVVIGAGPAGAVVARRLADDGRRVVLVESGPGGPRPPALVGLDLVAASAETGRHLPDLAVRDRPDGPSRAYRQGHGLGGGSMINGMLLTSGDRGDYERWAGAWGCVGWGADDLSPWLDGARATWPSSAVERGPVSAALAAAAQADGLPVGGTSLEGDRLGVLTADLAAVDGSRWSAADAHLGGDGPEWGPGRAPGRDPGPGWWPGQGRATAWEAPGGGLVVVAGKPVDRIVADAGPGWHEVRLAGGGVIAAPLVVVCAGAFGSPLLLARSGLTGRPVGATLVDHPSYAFTLVLRPEVWVAGRLAACPPVVSTLVRWSSGSGWPGDLQAFAIDRVAPPGHRGPPLAIVAVGLMAVTARGSLGIDPRPGRSPGVDVVTGVLGTEGDRRRLRAGVRRVARWLATEPFGPLVEAVHLDEDGRPLAELDALPDAELDRLMVERPGPYAHPAGTCPLGPADRHRSVTSIETGRFGELIDRPGIRLADTSVFPDLVSGGLQLPVTAVASRIAQDIVDGS